MAKRTSDPPSGNYEVGYGRPPEKNRWKAGQSGNPRGRRKGVKSRDTILRELLSSKVAVRDQNGVRKVSFQEASYMKLAAKVLQGDFNAFKFLLDIAPDIPEPLDLKALEAEKDPGKLMKIYQQMLDPRPKKRERNR